MDPIRPTQIPAVDHSVGPQKEHRIKKCFQSTL